MSGFLSLLRSWYDNGQCNIPRAAKPGLSNHEDGLALDTPDFQAWISALGNEDWDWFGNPDSVHFTYRGSGVRDDIGDIGVKAFQQLWNKNNPNDQITVDGTFRPQTAATFFAFASVFILLLCLDPSRQPSRCV